MTLEQCLNSYKTSSDDIRKSYAVSRLHRHYQDKNIFVFSYTTSINLYIPLSTYCQVYFVKLSLNKSSSVLSSFKSTGLKWSLNL